jgi:hypothetical protein
MAPSWLWPRGSDHMLKTTSLMMVAGIAVVSTAIPRTAALAGTFTLNEPGAMLLLATALFGLASIVRRHGKGERRS